MHTQQHPPHALAMLGVDKQKRLRGAVSTSSTNIDLSGMFNSIVTLQKLCFVVWRELPGRDISESDELDPAVLSKRAHLRIANHLELAEPTSDLPILNERLQTIRGLRGGKASKLARDVDGAVDEVVGPVILRLRLAIDDAAAAAPHRIKSLVEQLRSTLDDITLPEPNAEPIIVLGRIITSLGSLQQRRLAIPKKSLEFAQQRLTERVLPEYQAALMALAEERVSQRLKLEIDGLHQFLKELLVRSSQFTKNSDAVLNEIEGWRTEALHASHVSQASVILELKGPTEMDIITGLMTRLECKDQLTLGKTLNVKWEAALREQALGWLPPNAPFGLLLASLEPQIIANTFRHIVESSLGEGHSLYEIIERNGIESTALDLYDRAEHLCHLRSRDIEQYNVNPCSVTIVRLPPAVGPRDVELRERLAAKFLRLGHCSLVEGSASERNAITVIRTTVGWPIGIEGGNSGLLQEYARACAAGHLPHLIGIVTGTECGEAVPAYISLAAAFQTQA